MKRLAYSIIVPLALSMNGIANAQTELPTYSISSSKDLMSGTAIRPFTIGRGASISF